jgi:hypothetical protein
MGRRQDYTEMITTINVTVESWSDPALLNWRSIDHYWQGFFVGYLGANIDGW